MTASTGRGGGFSQSHGPSAPVAGVPLSPGDERLWSAVAHVSIPFCGVFGPLLVFLCCKDRGRLVRANAVESLNFSILYTIAMFVATLLFVVVIGRVLLPLVFLAALSCCTTGGVAANRGAVYRYPLNSRTVS